MIPKGNFTLLGKSDIDRMKASNKVFNSSINTASCSQGKDSKSPGQEQKEITRERANARTEYMLKVDLERNERSQTRKDRGPKKPEVNNEQSEDIVKQLKTCQQRAAAFAIRDKQLKDKIIREKEERDYERLMDLEMEVNRLKDIERREIEKEAKNKKRIADRKVIEDQIQERQHQRLLQEEARDQENRNMLEESKRFEREDACKALKKKEDAKRAKEEIIKNNEQMLFDRETRKDFEKKEEEMILEYLAQRDIVMQRREEEEAKSQKEKAELQKKLLESQTKILDKQSEMDELRARRAAEEAERRHRQRELEEAKKRKRTMSILHQSRKEQHEEKRIAKERDTLEKQEEYNDAMGLAAEMAKRERDESLIAEEKNLELRTMLQMQIEENERRNKILETAKYAEGREMKEKMESERNKLEAIRSNMVADMRVKGVNEKYFKEMLTLDLGKMLMK